MKIELLPNLSKSKTFRKLSMLLVFYLFVGASSYAQNTQVAGNVTDEQGIPLPGVSVVEKGKT